MKKLILLFLCLFIVCNSPVNVPNTSDDENIHPIVGKWCKAVPNEFHPWLHFYKDSVFQMGDNMGGGHLYIGEWYTVENDPLVDSLNFNLMNGSRYEDYYGIYGFVSDTLIMVFSLKGFDNYFYKIKALRCKH